MSKITTFDALDISWKEYCSSIQSLIDSTESVSIARLESGLEADVIKISKQDHNYVLKVWNRESKPDVSKQYKLLSYLHRQGCAVSKPYGWGIDVNSNQVLLTSFDGSPIQKVNKASLMKLASMLMEVHHLKQTEANGHSIPTYDFINYFFPGINEHVDIQELLVELVETSELQQSCLIHGDYNLGNIVEHEGNYTIIDWTNMQLGDPRYDIAWSIILMWIYVSESKATIYRSIFLNTTKNYNEDELEKFEAIACLRWILLYRTVHVPRRSNTIGSVRKILIKNKYLNEKLL